MRSKRVLLERQLAMHKRMAPACVPATVKHKWVIRDRYIFCKRCGHPLMHYATVREVKACPVPAQANRVKGVRRG